MGMLLAALAGGGAGALAGVGVRALLARLRRGVLVPVLPCAGTLAVLWTGPCGLVAAGRVPPAWLPAWLGLGALVVAGGAVDLAARRLPDAITGPAAVLALGALVPLGPAALLSGALGALLLGAVSGAVHLAAPAALGAGDVKLAPAVGAPLAAVSWGALAVVPLLAAVGVAGVVAAWALRGVRAGPVPYGPALLLAAWALLTVSLAAG